MWLWLLGRLGWGCLLRLLHDSLCLLHLDHLLQPLDALLGLQHAESLVLRLCLRSRRRDAGRRQLLLERLCVDGVQLDELLISKLRLLGPHDLGTELLHLGHERLHLGWKLRLLSSSCHHCRLRC